MSEVVSNGVERDESNAVVEGLLRSFERQLNGNLAARIDDNGNAVIVHDRKGSFISVAIKKGNGVLIYRFEYLKSADGETYEEVKATKFWNNVEDSWLKGDEVAENCYMEISSVLANNQSDDSECPKMNVSAPITSFSGKMKQVISMLLSS